MKRLYAPWRHDYVTKKEERDQEKKRKPLKNDCVFCDQLAQNDDEKYFILKRLERSVVIMNFYPYNAGHLMILPYEHKAELSDLDKETRAEMMEATNMSTTILESNLRTEGMNIGINLGVAGGGGIPKHLHIHVLPRWQGDTNFLATLGDTKLICSDLNEVYTLLKKEFDGASL